MGTNSATIPPEKPPNWSPSTIWLGYEGWTRDADVEMSEHGYIAMALGIFFSLVIGIGLMALVFYSGRAGYDEPPHQIGQQRYPGEE